MKRLSMKPLCWLPALALSGCATMPAATTPCDVTTPTFCFALPWQAKSTLSIPVDFALYDITLQDGGQVRVYDGRHPSKPEAAAPVYSAAKGDGHVSLYLGAGRRFDAYYEARGGGTLHVSGIVTDARREALRRFLSSFRKCERAARDTLRCTHEALFGQAADRL